MHSICFCSCATLGEHGKFFVRETLNFQPLWLILFGSVQRNYSFQDDVFGLVPNNSDFFPPQSTAATNSVGEQNWESIIMYTRFQLWHNIWLSKKLVGSIWKFQIIPYRLFQHPLAVRFFTGRSIHYITLLHMADCISTEVVRNVAIRHRKYGSHDL